MKSAAAALLGSLLTISPPGVSQETQYESSLGPNGGAPYLLTRAQLEAMGGVWTGGRFTTHAWFANTNDPASVTFVTRVTYTPVVRSKVTPEADERRRPVPHIDLPGHAR